MLVDSHCHLDHHLYMHDLDKVIERAKKIGVVIVSAGIDRNTNQINMKLAEKYDNVFFSLGYYPSDSLDREGYYNENPDAEITTVDQEIDFIKKQLKNKKFLAIGEIGLDLFTGKDIEKQKKEFRKLIELGIELKKPLLIHSRDAEIDALDVLDEFEDRIYADQVILHCFSGKKSLIKKAIEKGYCFSIPTNMVRSSSFKELVKLCPLDKILTETDGPYLSPYKNEDKSFNRNEPSYISESMKVISEIKNINLKETEKIIQNNFERVFKVKIGN